MDGQGGSQLLSFSFGGACGPSSFGFGSDDLFDNSIVVGVNLVVLAAQLILNLGAAAPQKKFRSINSQIFDKEIVDQGMAWLLLSHKPSPKDTQHFELVMHDVANSLQAALKVLLGTVWLGFLYDKVWE